MLGGINAHFVHQVRHLPHQQLRNPHVSVARVSVAPEDPVPHDRVQRSEAPCSMRGAGEQATVQGEQSPVGGLEDRPRLVLRRQGRELQQAWHQRLLEHLPQPRPLQQRRRHFGQEHGQERAPPHFERCGPVVDEGE